MAARSNIIEQKKGTKKVSIIVPIYKSEDFLPRLIEAMLNQTYSNLEIILVDDESPDKSGKICDDYASKDMRVRVVHKKMEDAVRHVTQVWD